MVAVTLVKCEACRSTEFIQIISKTKGSIIVKKYLVYIATAIAFVSIPIYAAEKAYVCLNYKTLDGWSDTYKVIGTIAKGYEIKGSIPSIQYKDFETFVVIFWEKDQVSVVEMKSQFISIGKNLGVDQQGREWKIELNCF